MQVHFQGFNKIYGKTEDAVRQKLIELEQINAPALCNLPEKVNDEYVGRFIDGADARNVLQFFGMRVPRQVTDEQFNNLIQKHFKARFNGDEAKGMEELSNIIFQAWRILSPLSEIKRIDV